MENLYFFSTLGPMTVTVALFWRWFGSPRARSLEPFVALQVLLAVHCFRFISPISLMPGVTVPGLSTEFTYPQVLGRGDGNLRARCDCCAAAASRLGDWVGVVRQLLRVARFDRHHRARATVSIRRARRSNVLYRRLVCAPARGFSFFDLRGAV